MPIQEKLNLLNGDTQRGPPPPSSSSKWTVPGLTGQVYDFNPQLATDNVRQEVKDAVDTSRRFPPHKVNNS